MIKSLFKCLNFKLNATLENAVKKLPDFCPSLQELKDYLVWSWNVEFVVFLVENRKQDYIFSVRDSNIYKGNYVMVIISVKNI